VKLEVMPRSAVLASNLSLVYASQISSDANPRKQSYITYFLCYLLIRNNPRTFRDHDYVTCPPFGMLVALPVLATAGVAALSVKPPAGWRLVCF